jgi:hypothetical protein
VQLSIYSFFWYSRRTPEGGWEGIILAGEARDPWEHGPIVRVEKDKAPPAAPDGSVCKHDSPESDEWFWSMLREP